MAGCRRDRRWARFLRLLGLGRRQRPVCGDWYEEPPDALVREPRRPRPFGPAAPAMLELPE